MEDILVYLKQFCDIKENVSFKVLTTYKVGGIARAVIYPFDIDSLIRTLKYLKKKKISYKIWGRGSNIIPSDKDYSGIIIKLDNLNKIDIKSRSVVAGAGVNLMALANQICSLGYTGFEFATGIPGSVGGSVYMNAGAYNCSIGDIISSIKVLDKDFDIVELDRKELNFGYRHSLLQECKYYICVEAKFSILKSDANSIKNLVQERKKRREETQPLNYPSAGSVFRNPPEMFAGKLIEDVKLKGKKVGGAMISDKHANFIVNFDNAKASDVMKLIEMAKEKVKKEFNVDLRVEQEFFNWE